MCVVCLTRHNYTCAEALLASSEEESILLDIYEHGLNQRAIGLVTFFCCTGLICLEAGTLWKWRA
jgi:hypothetical protein